MTEAVILTGIQHTIDALKEFDKDAVRQFNRVVNEVLFMAKSEALVFVDEASTHGGGAPMSGWSTKAVVHPGKTRGGEGWPAWDVAQVKKGIIASHAEGKVRGDYTTNVASLKNTSAAGVIFELAGRRSGKSTLSDRAGSGEQFKRTLSNLYKPASRLVWRAVDNHRESYRRSIEDALDRAKSELQRHLDSPK